MDISLSDNDIPTRNDKIIEYPYGYLRTASLSIVTSNFSNITQAYILARLPTQTHVSVVLKVCLALKFTFTIPISVCQIYVDIRIPKQCQ
jgi:hypothetical protein